MNGGVDWVSSLTVLGVGLAVGAVLVWRVLAAGRGAEPAATTPSLELRDRAAKKDALIQQRRELEDTAEKRNPVQLPTFCTSPFPIFARRSRCCICTSPVPMQWISTLRNRFKRWTSSRRRFQSR